jgi:FixJ family two-component response regulator
LLDDAVLCDESVIKALAHKSVGVEPFRDVNVFVPKHVKTPEAILTDLNVPSVVGLDGVVD